MAGETSERASLLAISWDQVAKLVTSELKVYREWTLDSAAIGVAWLDDQCLLDGQKTGIVLSASPLIIEDSGSLTVAPGNVSASHSGIGSMMGGVVEGSLFKEGSSLVEEGVVIFVTDQTALVVRFSPKLELYTQLSRPDRGAFMPYTAWKCPQFSQNSSPGKNKIRLIPEYAPLDEEGTVESAFELIFAADEVISLGHKESVTVAQVKQYCEMESHEEKLHKLVMQSKINETKDVMKRKANEIDKSKVAF
ncbi:hypothetical protein IFM89_021113 [Coptis chinensis]|uniref:Coatomer subunit delta n=1 Tax=Coptis chinensis TaxID=261450 RepID=A0A835HNU6_9MAGN|nr:hypothetical protein IFM89_021113 [Coptis chinensis]